MAKKGSKLSEEHKQKISKTRKDRHISPAAGFKKGNIPWNKGKKTGIIPQCAFKKGQTPWNKGTKGVMKAWNKGKKFPERSGSKHHNWKGGRCTSRGYIYILQPAHPFCDFRGYVAEHRLVMEKHLGRYLAPEEEIHHRGIKYPLGSLANRADNRLENLMYFATHSAHISFEMKLKFKKSHKV